MREPKDRYLNEMINRAMKDDSRSSGYNPADHEPGNQALEEDQARGQRRSKMSGQTEDQAQGQMLNHVRDQVHSHAQVQSSGYSEGQGTQTIASPEEGKGKDKDKSRSKGRGIFLKGLISGTVISDSMILRDIRYSAMIALLAIVFIANRFNAERMEREITVLEQEVRDLRAEALSVSADLGSVSRQSEISDLVKERGLGLEELREPPYRIVVNKQ